MFDAKYPKMLLLIAVFTLLLTSIATSQQTPATPSPAATAFCTGTTKGTGSSGGVIPSTNILSGSYNGEQSLVTVSVFIMLTMLMVVAVIYMFSYVLALNNLKNFVKQEIAEIAITVFIVIILLGGFNVASAAVSSNTVHIAGVTFGQQTFIDDCTYLTSSSASLIGPFLLINFVKLTFDIAESFKVTVTPAYFGIVISPLQGFDLFDSVIKILDEVTGAFIILILTVAATLGFIYGLFPIFLYAGIILRTIPWTRAAGGAFLGLFIGFYIVFPLLLHVMLSGYVASAAALSLNSNPTSIQTFINGAATQAASGGTAELGSAVSLITQAATLFVGTSGGGSFGIVNGYIFYVLEPAGFTILVIIISFMISFDFAETAGDLLGSPSLKADSLFQKVI